MDKGWGRGRWGAWMGRAKASLMLGFDGRPAGDVELLIEARVRPVVHFRSARSVRSHDLDIEPVTHAHVPACIVTD